MIDLDELRNPMFDKSCTKKRIGNRWALEGQTFTDNYCKVNFVCFSDGECTITKPENGSVLYKGKLKTEADFNKAIKKADKKYDIKRC